MIQVATVREAIDIAMKGGQASVRIGGATLVAGDGQDSIFIDADCAHFFDDGFCLLCGEPGTDEARQ